MDDDKFQYYMKQNDKEHGQIVDSVKDVSKDVKLIKDNHLHDIRNDISDLNIDLKVHTARMSTTIKIVLPIIFTIITTVVTISVNVMLGG